MIYLPPFITYLHFYSADAEMCTPSMQSSFPDPGTAGRSQVYLQCGHSRKPSPPG
mgnify:CR=1 FL=1